MYSPVASLRNVTYNVNQYIILCTCTCVIQHQIILWHNYHTGKELSIRTNTNHKEYYIELVAQLGTAPVIKLYY